MNLRAGSLALLTNLLLFTPALLFILKPQVKEYYVLELEFLDYQPLQSQFEEKKPAEETTTTIKKGTSSGYVGEKTEFSNHSKRETHGPDQLVTHNYHKAESIERSKQETNSLERFATRHYHDGRKDVQASSTETQQKEGAPAIEGGKSDTPVQTQKKEGLGVGEGEKAKETELLTSRGAVDYQRHYEARNWSFIRELVHKHLEYPHMAVLRGWQGRVVVRVCLEGRAVCGLEVKESSGYGLLDQYALKAVQKASREVPYAEQRVYLLLPIKFELAEVR